MTQDKAILDNMTQKNNTIELDDGHILAYLQEHPDFFERQAGFLGAIKLQSSHGGRAISLQERQMEVMREKHKTLEGKLAELIHIARDNDAIVDKMHHWTRQLLIAQDNTKLSDTVLSSLNSQFSVPFSALRLWGVKTEFTHLPVAAAVPVETITLTNSMVVPYCGMNSDFQAATWLPEEGRQARSLALLPLRVGADPKSFGLIVLGSPDPERFKASMQTAYLSSIAEIASAALSRLME
jgi:uncharacterized protein